ncbi:uncharacterized protein LOC108834662 [Raphanus sativus]|uniref:Uncharacterized protein LOC108834662 n=1 Tax=Raphanus sativus TaxID=3726 RepID=A0A6J0LTW9_RAPSA|nr:uncharacterized protein LOC108834662 [Raphanus sativus]
MSAAMDKALMAMSLEEEDTPFVMPDLPEYRSTERNNRSLIGRLLNPACQKMAKLILEMPRKWQKQGRVRGIALSRERFQFIFDHEHDLLDVIDKGVHTHNEWPIALERWSENPPPDSLQFVPLWVQIRNIPPIYYNERAIEALGDIVGDVTVVAFDPNKAQCQEFVRVKVRFDVSRPLRKDKVLDLPKGEKTKIFFHYERIQKRCYTCQHMTHDQSVCPLEIQRRQNEAASRRAGIPVVKKKPLILQESDPLFGVLSESQVGLNPNTGRPKIAEEVLEGMRQYLLLATDEDSKIREERVKKSVAEAEKDPILKKTALSLEPVPMVTTDLLKGKGIVFDYSSVQKKSIVEVSKPSDQKLMAASIKANRGTVWGADHVRLIEGYTSESKSTGSSSSRSSSTGCRLGSRKSNLPGVTSANLKTRKRPGKNKRKSKASPAVEDQIQLSLKDGVLIGCLEKRKTQEEMGGVPKAAKQTTREVVPHEGRPNA